jgi:uncharacterized protein (DUF1015 family)
MATIRPFRGHRPLPLRAAQVASRPYDVLNSEEARQEAADNPDSFLHVVKPEVNFPPDQDPYTQEIYTQGRDHFEHLIDRGLFMQDEKPCYYLYRLIWQGRAQHGIMGAAAVSDYEQGVIKKHELTRPDKEEDRRQHIRISGLNAEPVFFAYPSVPELSDLMRLVVQGEATVNFAAEDGVQHTLWVIDAPTLVDRIERIFAEQVPATYVADGHHRTAAAAGVGQELRAANLAHSGQEAYNFFLAVHFPAEELRIIDYNRVVADLNGLSPEAFLTALQAHFEVRPWPEAYRPDRRHRFGLYLDRQWYRLVARPDTYHDQDPIAGLDVTILTEQVLGPLLGIEDLRRDQRIDFVGGIRGLGELVRRVDEEGMAAAFSLYPVSMAQLMAIADAGKIMPPKTTWFEPKLRSGLVVYSLAE